LRNEAYPNKNVAKEFYDVQRINRPYAIRVHVYQKN
jgi:hypothetical protein